MPWESTSAGKTFQQLAKQYNDFAVPAYLLLIDGKEMKPADLQITDISAKLTSDFEMNSCEFNVAASYNQEKGKLDPDIYTLLKPGKSVDLKMGYGTPEDGVFKGYINSLSFSFNSGGIDVFVQCLDAKGALVKSNKWLTHSSEKISALVEKILKAKCSKYADIKVGTLTFDPNIELNKNRQEIDDYHFIIELAKIVNASFCVVYDTLNFCDNLGNTAKEKVRLKWGESLMEFSTEINLSGQVGSVNIHGTDPQTQEHFSTDANSVKGSGTEAAAVATIVGNRSIDEVSTKVIDKNQATKLADSRLQALASKFSRCRGKTIGIPIIKAGDRIGVSGMGSGIDGTYFLTQVTHRINGQGYETSFEGQRSKITIGQGR